MNASQSLAVSHWPAQARIAAARLAEAAEQREMQSRKERSISILKAEGVPYIDHLPVIEAEGRFHAKNHGGCRASGDPPGSRRCQGGGLSGEMVDEMMRKYGTFFIHSPEEKRFLSDPRPSESDRNRFAWRFESYWTLVWALGFVDTLDRPNQACDPREAISRLMQHDRDDFLKRGALRPRSELLDAADLHYPYHWAVRNAQLKSRSIPARLNADVVMERHYALNWLIGHGGQSWDDVPTDT